MNTWIDQIDLGTDTDDSDDLNANPKRRVGHDVCIG